METLFEIDTQNIQKCKNLLLKDEIVSKGSITFREGRSLGFDREGYYCYISGSEEVCERAKDLIKSIGKEVRKEERDEIIQRMKEEEESAMSGFGSIFG